MSANISQRIALLMSVLLFTAFPFMARATIISDPYPAVAGQSVKSSELNARFNTILNDYNGLITTANVSPSAAIPFSKLDATVQYGPVLRAAASAAFSAGNTGDTQPRIQVTSDGYLKFGAGSASALDVLLRRKDANTVQVTNAAVSANKTYEGDTFDARTFGDANGKTVLSTLGIKFGAGVASALDALLKRESAGVLAIRDAADSTYADLKVNNLTIGGTIPAAGITTATIGTTHAGALDCTSLSDTETVTAGRVYGRTAASNGAPSFLAIQDSMLPLQALLDGGRLSGDSVNPVADASSSTSLYWVPYLYNKIALYDGSTTWKVYTPGVVTLASFTATSGSNYDVFMFDNAGTPTLEILVWTNNTTRATALAYQDGVLVKSGATTRRYLGSFRATGANQFNDNSGDRALYNYNNRVSRSLVGSVTTASWAYNSSARGINGNTTNGQGRCSFMIGVAEDTVQAVGHAYATQATAASVTSYALSQDLTTLVGVGTNDVFTVNLASASPGNLSSFVSAMNWATPIGYHFIQQVEAGNSATTTWSGDQGGSNSGGRMEGTVRN